MGLSEADRVRMLEELAQDVGLKATQRLRALEELGRMEARKAAVPVRPLEEEVPRDPMDDFDELGRRRELRVRRRAG